MGTTRGWTRWLLLAFAAASTGCGSSSTGPGPEPCGAQCAPAAYFDRLWEDFDQRYSFFVVKGIDWNAARATYRPRVEAGATPAELWTVLTEMLGTLEDGHVSLESNAFGYWSYTGWYDRYPENFDLDVVRDRYLGGELDASSDGRLLYGRLSADVGYVHIPGFGGSGWRFIEEVGAALGDARALVIDVRDNGGGNDQNGREIASHFVDERRLFRIIRWRNGPRHDDFDPPIEDYVEPSSPRFAGPVVLLTNRRVFSSAEGFVLMMRQAPNVTVVGDTTGGGSANPEERVLQNGWTYRVSRWWVQTPEGRSFEGVGLAPDVPVQISAEDAAEGRDTILEKALEIIDGQLGARASAPETGRGGRFVRRDGR